MTYKNLTDGIDLIRAGHHQEGARFLRIALKEPDDITPVDLAKGWVWLAETMQDVQGKLRCYREALKLDPTNTSIQRRIQKYSEQIVPSMPPEQAAPATPPPPDSVPQATTPSRAAPMQPPPPAEPTPPQAPPVSASATAPAATQATPVDYNNFNAPAPAQPSQPVSQSPKSGRQAPPMGTPPPPSQQRPPIRQTASLHRTVAILGGPNGKGTGFFITRDGLIATSRHVVGGSLNITYELNGGSRATGQVVRSWAVYDLALIYTGLKLQQLIPPSSSPIVPDNTPLTAITHGGRVLNGHRRATLTEFHEDWFPTTIDTLEDAGGNPVFNEQNLLIGMLTANANRSAPYVFGLQISFILGLVDQYTREMHGGGTNMMYCGACGNLSRAVQYGGFYCEYCGTVLPHSVNAERFPMPQMAMLYEETMSRACVGCGSTAGYHKGKCLRCGHLVR